MNFEIEELPALKIAFTRKIGPYGEGNRLTMEKIKSFAKNYDLFDENSVILGIAQDDPERTKPENCRYDACLVVADDFKTMQEDIEVGNIKGGKYAVFTLIHTAEEVMKAWAEIFVVLAQQGYHIDSSKPIIERYATKMVFDHKCEICVPIV